MDTLPEPICLYSISVITAGCTMAAAFIFAIYISKRFKNSSEEKLREIDREGERVLFFFLLFSGVITASLHFAEYIFTNYEFDTQNNFHVPIMYGWIFSLVLLSIPYAVEVIRRKRGRELQKLASFGLAIASFAYLTRIAEMKPAAGSSTAIYILVGAALSSLLSLACPFIVRDILGDSEVFMYTVLLCMAAVLLLLSGCSVSKQLSKNESDNSTSDRTSGNEAQSSALVKNKNGDSLGRKNEHQRRKRADKKKPNGKKKDPSVLDGNSLVVHNKSGKPKGERSITAERQKTQAEEVSRDLERAIKVDTDEPGRGKNVGSNNGVEKDVESAPEQPRAENESHSKEESKLDLVQAEDGAERPADTRTEPSPGENQLEDAVADGADTRAVANIEEAMLDEPENFVMVGVVNGVVSDAADPVVEGTVNDIVGEVESAVNPVVDGPGIAVVESAADSVVDNTGNSDSESPEKSIASHQDDLENAIISRLENLEKTIKSYLDDPENALTSQLGNPITDNVQTSGPDAVNDSADDKAEPPFNPCTEDDPRQKEGEKDSIQENTPVSARSDVDEKTFKTSVIEYIRTKTGYVANHYAPDGKTEIRTTIHDENAKHMVTEFPDGCTYDYIYRTGKAYTSICQRTNSHGFLITTSYDAKSGRMEATTLFDKTGIVYKENPENGCLVGVILRQISKR